MAVVGCDGLVYGEYADWEVKRRLVGVSWDTGMGICLFSGGEHGNCWRRLVVFNDLWRHGIFVQSQRVCDPVMHVGVGNV